MPKRKSLCAEKKPPPPQQQQPAGGAAVTAAVAGVRNNDGHERHDPIQDEPPAPPGIPATAASAASEGMGPLAAVAPGGAAAAGIGAAGAGDAVAGGRRGVGSSGRAVRNRRQATAKAKAPRPPRPPVRPPVRYLRGGGFGAVGYPRIDLELSSARARFRRLDDSLRELDYEVVRVSREVAEVQAGLEREANWYEDRTQEFDREVQEAAAGAATLTLQEQLAVKTEILCKAREWSAQSKAQLAVWTERNVACKRKFEAVDRKRQWIRLAIAKFRYYRLAALPPALREGRGPHYYYDDDDSD